MSRRRTPEENAARAARKREAKARGAYTPPASDTGHLGQHASAPAYRRIARDGARKFYDTEEER